MTRFGGSGERGCIGVGTTTLVLHLILEVGSGSSPREHAWQTPLTPALTRTCSVSFLFSSTWKSSPLGTSSPRFVCGGKLSSPSFAFAADHGGALALVVLSSCRRPAHTSKLSSTDALEFEESDCLRTIKLDVVSSKCLTPSYIYFCHFIRQPSVTRRASEKGYASIYIVC